MKVLLLTLCAGFALASPLSAQVSQAPDPASALVADFMAAWSAADAKGLANLFADGADLVTPDGMHAQGRAGIEAFYAAAFARGYGGSRGAGEIVSERNIAPGLMLVDARWSIAGAHNPDGSARPAENGILAAVLSHAEAGWRIVALRENAGAKDLTKFPPAR